MALHEMSATDVIVVGAGTTGCVVALRLARDFGLRVTLVEPPGNAAPTEDRQRPARWLRLLGSTEDYQLATNPCAALAGRSTVWPRGRGLGGSSRINAMIWHESTPHDRDQIEQASGGVIAPAMIVRATAELERLIQPEKPRWVSESAQAFVAAFLDDDNHPIIYPRFNRDGKRWTAKQLLQLAPAGSITVVRRIVDRVLWRDNTAIGVRCLNDHGEENVFAGHGVVLSAGAIASPTILCRSGIGPESTLAALGITAIRNCEAVGKNLQDHLVMPIIFQTRETTSFVDTVSTAELCRWLVSGCGPLACNIAECGGLFRDGQLQLHVTPTHYLKFPYEDGPPALTIAVNATQPFSRGYVRCATIDPRIAPEIETGYLSDSRDLCTLIDAVHWIRRTLTKSPLNQFIAAELVPGERRMTDEAIAKSVARYSQTLYHPVGTLAMGSDFDSVVDARFFVKGCDRLWVADGSILPVITQANPSVTLMSLAWLAAAAVAQTSMQR